MLTPSTHFAYPQVDSRTFGSFRVLIFSISAAHTDFCAWFDSRQLHNKAADERPFSFGQEVTWQPGEHGAAPLEPTKSTLTSRLAQVEAARNVGRSGLGGLPAT